MSDDPVEMAVPEAMSAIQETLSELNPEARLADGFEDALVGIGQQFNLYLAVYDVKKAREVLMKRDGMSEDDAQDYLEFNVLGAYVGDNTPIFLLDNLE